MDIIGLPERLKQVRRIKNLSQTDFGKKFNVSRDVIKNIEAGTLRQPEQKIPLLELIAVKTGVRKEWLIDGEEPMYKDTSRSGEMASYVASMLAGDAGTVQKGVLDLLLTLMASLTVEQWELIAQKAQEIAAEQNGTEE